MNVHVSREFSKFTGVNASLLWMLQCILKDWVRITPTRRGRDWADDLHFSVVKKFHSLIHLSS